MSQGNHLLTKSEEYLRAAELNVDCEYCAASIHAAYYSLVLLTLYWALVDEDRTSGDFFPKKGSKQTFHGNIILYIVGIIQKIDRKFAYDLTMKFNDLKTLRINADYKNKSISLNKAQQALNDASFLYKGVKERLTI